MFGHMLAHVIQYKMVQSRNKCAWYLGGVASGAVLVWAAGLAARRWIYPQPAAAISSVLPSLRAQREIRERVGAQLTPGHLQAYFLRGGPRWQLRTPFLYWEPLSLSVLLQVHGEVSSAFVGMSLSLHKELRSLVVDLPSGERLLLKGAPTGEERRGHEATTEHSSLQRYKPFPEN